MFAEKLKNLRTQQKISQDELARALGISRSTVAMWETGRREPDFESVRSLSALFNVTADYLLGNADRKDRVSNEDLSGLGIEWVSLAKKFRASGLSPEQVEKLLEELERKQP